MDRADDDMQMPLDAESPDAYSSGYRAGVRQVGGPSAGGKGILGCLPALLLIFVVLLLLFGIGAYFLLGPGGTEDEETDITRSTIEREPLPLELTVPTDYYSDELGWITDEETLLVGMESFFNATGVQPFLYLADGINGNYTPTESEAYLFSEALYGSLFSDQAHLLLIFMEDNGKHSCWYLVGAQAQSVIDDEAMQILLDYIERYYAYSELSDEEFFSRAFAEAGERIMHYEKPASFPTLLFVLLIIALLILIFVLLWRSTNRRQREKARMRKILETPVEPGDTGQAGRFGGQ